LISPPAVAFAASAPDGENGMGSIEAIKRYLDKHRNHYRCRSCLESELKIDVGSAFEAFRANADQHVLVERGECGHCNEVKEVLIMH
jgi:hypothetical protein